MLKIVEVLINHVTRNMTSVQGELLNGQGLKDTSSRNVSVAKTSSQAAW